MKFSGAGWWFLPLAMSAACGETVDDSDSRSGTGGTHANAGSGGSVDTTGATHSGGLGAAGGISNTGGGVDGGAGGADATEPPSAWLTSPQSWDVVASLTVTRPPVSGPMPDCPQVAFTLYTEPAPGEPSGDALAWVTHAGGPWKASLLRNSYGYTLNDLELPTRQSCKDYEGTISALALKILDENGDGIADRLLGTGTGSGTVNAGPGSVRDEFDVEISGVPDVTPPKLMQSEPLNPLDFSGHF